VVPREDAWSGGDNIEDDLDHARFETGESNSGPHVVISESDDPWDFEDGMGRIIVADLACSWERPTWSPIGGCYCNEAELQEKIEQIENDTVVACGVGLIDRSVWGASRETGSKWDMITAYEGQVESVRYEVRVSDEDCGCPPPLLS
jgi:hypothetical protein